MEMFTAVLFFFFFFEVVGTQDLVLARQGPYHLSHVSSNSSVFNNVNLKLSHVPQLVKE
jgi:hypothetical protein